MAAKGAADFLLLEDIIGERLTRGERYIKIVVNKGALLKAASLSTSTASETFSVRKAGKPRSKIKYKGTTVRIPGGRESSKVAVLSEVERKLLKGVNGDSARYEVYTSGRLKINSGDDVFVELASVSEPIAAVLRWRGVVDRGSAVPGFRLFGDNTKELKFGIEIVDTRYYGCGNSNGRLNGVDYFHCENNCGSFVSWDKFFLPSNFDDASDTQSTGHECIARDVKWAVSTETLSSFLSVDDNDSSLLIPAQHTEGHKCENQHKKLEGYKELTVTEINFSTGFEREWWEIPRKSIQVSDVMIQKNEWGCVMEGTLCRQKVAVKSFHQDIVAQFASHQIQKEMRKMVQVHHPNLLLVIGAVLDSVAGPLIVTELFEQTLQSAYKDHLLEEHSKLPILRDVASALNYLHSQCPPIVHGGVNCSNVLLEALQNRKWKAKLSDFGMINLIRLMHKTPKQDTDEYLAPEFHSGKMCHNDSASLKIDVFSFGVLLRKISFNSSISSSPENGTGVDPRIFHMAKNCTRLLPHERPTMEENLRQIDEVL